MRKALRIHGVPLHPLFVHFPVTAWTVATGLAVLAAIQDMPVAATLARQANLFGIVTGLIAILFGALELPFLPADASVRDTVARHLAWAGTSWTLYLVMWLLQVKQFETAALLAGLPGFAALLAAGHAGARLVHHHGFPARFENPR